MQFLKGQKSIKNLRIQTIWNSQLGASYMESQFNWLPSEDEYYDPDRIPDSVIEAATDPAFLPKLSCLCSEPLKCTALAPGRPIKQVVITQNMNAPSLWDDRFAKLAVALGKTSVPLESLEFSSRFAKPMEVTTWEFFGLVCQTSVPEQLRELVLHEPEGVSDIILLFDPG